MFSLKSQRTAAPTATEGVPQNNLGHPAELARLAQVQPVKGQLSDKQLADPELLRPLRAGATGQQRRGGRGAGGWLAGGGGCVGNAYGRAAAALIWSGAGAES